MQADVAIPRIALRIRKPHASAMNKPHVVLGAGQIGPLVAAELRERGIPVRIGRKTPGRGAIALDVRDPEQVARIAEGAAVVYHCVNPLYHQWPELLLPMTRGIVEGTKRAGARLVALDNLYMYGDTARMNPETPVSPRSRKGELRARAAELMLEGGAAVGRASDFFGPGAALGAIFGERFHQRVLAGKSAECFGDPEMPHSYSYTPDVARGLVQLGLDGAAAGVFMLPVHPAEPTRALIDRFGARLGRPVGVQRVPTFLLRALGVFSPIMREVAEMTYQWKQPFVVDDAAFRSRYRIEPTPLEEAVAATLDWAEQNYAPARAA
jgi:nucleoside-diphosphate-sugar epimerase